MPVYHGSSFFVIGETGTTGATGPTGGTGATGATGLGGYGVTGTTGSNVVGITLDSDNYLVTTFQLHSGEYETYTTTTKIQGGNGLAFVEIRGGNTYDSVIAGSTVGHSKLDHKTIKIRTIEGTGGVILTQNQYGITLDYDRGKFGYIGVTGGYGEINQLLGYTSDMLHGMTGTTFDDGSGGGILDLKVRNFKENVRQIKLGEVSGNTRIDTLTDYIDGATAYWIGIDPTEAKTFVFSTQGIADGVDYASVIFSVLDENLPDGELSSFTLVTHGVTGIAENRTKFSYNVRFPAGIAPCFSGGTDIINFFSYPDDGSLGSDPTLNHIWYGNVVKWNGDSTNNMTNVFGCHSATEYDETGYTMRGLTGFIAGSTGACCTVSGCIHTSEELCNGYFYGAGTTCGYTGNSGNTGSICFGRGSCCVKDETTGSIVCYDNVTTTECISMGDIAGSSSIYGGDDSRCLNQNCNDAFNNYGACCDGLGGCEYIDIDECRKLNRFFMGLGKSCTYRNYNICSGGTGACCRDTGCEDDVGGTDCLGTGDVYGGENSTCASIKCPTPENNTSCLARVYGVDLEPGDLYAGGIVVGMYKPKGSQCLGATGFGADRDTNWKELMSGGTGNTSDILGLTSGIYYSRYDYHGYGFDSNNSCVELSSIQNKDNVSPDSYIIIASMEPIAITGDREIISLYDYPGATSEFYWSNRGSSWGPLYNTNTGLYDDLNTSYKKNVLQYSEGFWYNANVGDRSLRNIALNTFSDCNYARQNGSDAINKLLTDRIQSAHGNWMRNWGLYNSSRMISADNALYANYDDTDGHYSSSDFGIGLTGDYISAIRATRLLADGLTSDIQSGATGNIENVSGWYLPSHDELAFLASNCLIDEYSPYGFNLNISLMQNGGIPIQGWHWSSTGSFDENDKAINGNTAEGVIYNKNVNPGTLAWAMNFDDNGVKDNFKSAKKNRTQNTYKVRPIRMIRCDGQYVTGGALVENEKLWNLPIVLRDEDRGIN